VKAKIAAWLMFAFGVAFLADISWQIPIGLYLIRWANNVLESLE